MAPPTVTPGEIWALATKSVPFGRMSGLWLHTCLCPDHLSAAPLTRLGRPVAPALNPALSRSEPGTIAKMVGTDTWASCDPCPAGTYRSGDASASNNVCIQIPAGVLGARAWGVGLGGLVACCA